MRTAITALALAGLTAGADAGHFVSTGMVTLTSSAATVNVGDVFTIGVLLTDNIPGNSVFAFDVLVSGSGAAFSTLADSIVVDPFDSGFVFGFNGQVNPDGAQGLGGSSDILGPTFDRPLDNVIIFTFQVLATQGGSISFNPEDGPGPNLAMHYASSALFRTLIAPVNYDEIIFNGITITVIPAPSGAALLLLAGLISTRRRR